MSLEFGNGRGLYEEPGGAYRETSEEIRLTYWMKWIT